MIDKICTKCKILKPLSEYYNCKKNSTGRTSRCAECSRVDYKEYREADLVYAGKVAKKSFNTFYSTIHGRAVHMLNNLKARSKRNEITVEDSLNIEWIKSKLNLGICEITDIPFILIENKGKGHKTNSFAPSIDRINPTGAYSAENCQMTCWIYNRAKGAFPIDDLNQMMVALIDNGLT